ncbi:MAG: hypothetical protein AB7L84_13665, partial [Acidimicrobiia bacterium]
LKRRIDALSAVSSTAPEMTARDSDQLVSALVDRLGELRALADGGLPLLLDDPFGTVDASVKPFLLELLGQAAAGQQIVLLTDDEEAASWARLERLTGDIVLIEPSPSPSP